MRYDKISLVDLSAIESQVSQILYIEKASEQSGIPIRIRASIGSFGLADSLRDMVESEVPYPR